VTDPNAPPGGGDKAAPKSTAPARAADKPAVQAPRSAAPPPPNSSKPAIARSATATGAASPGSPAPRPRSIGETLLGRDAAAPSAAASSPNRIAAAPERDAERASPDGADARAPKIERRATENGTRAADSSRNDPKRIVPRSPRTAIEPDTVEMPLRRSASARHPLVVIGNAIISIFVLLAVLTGVVLFVGTQRFDAPGPLPRDRIVNIPHGSGMRDIADVLTREGVIDQPWVFIGGVLVLKAREGLKAGEYEFKAHSSLRDVVATIVDGRVVAHQVSIPEGLTSQQIVARLLADDDLVGDIKTIPAEGTLLPDTYNFTRGTTREQMIQRMQQAQQRAVQEIWAHRAPDLPLKTPEQLVTLASLVEKETGKSDERSRVAAVFINRMKQNMRLQSDPTIIYGLVGGKGTLGRPIMKSEITQPTPYNTYVINGLPPGPITNPGRASLEAAANPARTRELYFVADGTGGHLFAETYEQQQRNVARLRLIESDQKDQVPIDDQMNSPPPPQGATANSAAPLSAPALRGTTKPRVRAGH
jgi:UPF0755 protein